MLREMRLIAVLVAAMATLVLAIDVAAAEPAWKPLAHVAGVLDVSAPRTDGKLVVAGAGKLYLMDLSGKVTALANGEDKGAEPYLAVSPGLAGTGCSFAPDDLFILRLHAPIGVTRIAAGGARSNFASLPLAALGGIAFDTTGAFGHRLLVAGNTKAGERELIALDCAGHQFVINGALPANEGGFAVAPSSFGAFAGMVIAPDELSGKIWAFGGNGTVQLLVDSGLPHGGDVGVESAGFVPPGFLRGGTAFLADRLTPGGAHPGSDSVLTLSSADLATAGVQEGDLLVATEGGAQTIDVRCTDSCTVKTVIGTATKAHAEGHLIFVTTAPPPSPSPSASPAGSPSPQPAPSGGLSPVVLAALVLGVGVAAATVLVVVLEVRRPR